MARHSNDGMIPDRDAEGADRTVAFPAHEPHSGDARPSGDQVRDDSVRDDSVREDRVREDRVREDRVREDQVREDRAHEKFGGLNLGAAFFGWIVAIGVAVLLAGIIGAVLAAVDSSVDVIQSEADRVTGTIGVSTAIVLLVILALSYYAGGYVAGRMSRFDGARQGVGVWGIGLLVTVVAIALGAIFGDKYNVLDRVDLPRIPISTDELTWGAVAAGVAVVLVTLLFAILGGVLGHRYHHRVDRAVRH